MLDRAASRRWRRRSAELAAGPLTVPRHLAGYLDNGRIVRYPSNDDDLGELLARVVELIGAGTVHSEASLTAALAAIAEPAELRRRLVDHGLVETHGERFPLRREGPGMIGAAADTGRESRRQRRRRRRRSNHPGISQAQGPLGRGNAGK